MRFLRRLSIAVVVLGLLVALAAGLSTRGPLAALGWTTQAIPPEAVLVDGASRDAAVLAVQFPWDRQDACGSNPRVVFTESADQVVVRMVQIRVPRFPSLAPKCRAGWVEGGRSVAELTLQQPLRQRVVVTSSGRVMVPRTR